ncbi:MAG: RluA family pseudouridine synthase [Candidatus Riflebacteria bacterium]
MNNMITWVVEPDFAGQRLDAAVSQKFGTSISRTRAQDMIKSGEITIDGTATKPGLKLKGGEKILLPEAQPDVEPTLDATPLNFPVLYEDRSLIVINKPNGLVVHPGAGAEKETVVSALLGYCKLSPIGAPLRPGVVHRLDKGTSGVMVLAKSKETHRKLAQAFAGHEIEKEYLAIIQGHIVNRKGRIEVAIERDKTHRQRMKATSPEKGRLAVSQFEVIEYLKGATLVKVRILTGRTHQIRVHMAFTGHPLLGDVIYGGKRFNGLAEHFLHSRRLALKHPANGKAMEWKAELPESFLNALKSLGSTLSQLPL